jgi:large subunit ribosomal protein L23
MFKLNLFKKDKRPAEKATARGGAEVAASQKEASSRPAAKSADKYPLGIVIAPRITEKATRLTEAANQYVFEVADNANAYLIKRAVEGKYGVRVSKVNVLNQPGKKVRLGRQEGWRRGFRKAIVTLEKGQSIEFT